MELINSFNYSRLNKKIQCISMQASQMRSISMLNPNAILIIFVPLSDVRAYNCRLNIMSFSNLSILILFLLQTEKRQNINRNLNWVSYAYQFFFIIIFSHTKPGQITTNSRFKFNVHLSLRIYVYKDIIRELFLYSPF